jgi:hypothetical protein
LMSRGRTFWSAYGTCFEETLERPCSLRQGGRVRLVHARYGDCTDSLWLLHAWSLVSCSSLALSPKCSATFYTPVSQSTGRSNYPLIQEAVVYVRGRSSARCCTRSGHMRQAGVPGRNNAALDQPPARGHVMDHPCNGNDGAHPAYRFCHGRTWSACSPLPDRLRYAK